MSTERDMLDMLLTRYNTERQGTIADRWVRAEHVRSTQTHFELTSIADFVAIDKYASSQAIHGHEVKVSRSDWLTELRDLTKSLAPEPLTLDFVAGLTAAVQRTACREPLRHDARVLGRWAKDRGYYRQCQACGEPAPCQLHQPRAYQEVIHDVAG